MAKDRSIRDQKRKKKLQERKQKVRLTASLACMGRKYQTDELAPMWMYTEIGIYEIYVMSDRQLLDQTVVAAIERLIRQLRAGTLAPLEAKDVIDYQVGGEEDFVIENIRSTWARHFAEEWQPPKDKLIGVLRSILGSIEKMRAPGARSQNYLRHIEGFLTKKLGVSVMQYSPNIESVAESRADDPLTIEHVELT